MKNVHFENKTKWAEQILFFSEKNGYLFPFM